MNRALIINLGFDEKFAIRALTRHGVSKGDKVILLTGPRVERVEKATSYVRTFLEKYYPGEAELEVVEVPVNDFYDAVSRVMNTLRGVSRKERIIVNLSGGMRIVVLAVFTALMLLGLEGLTVEVEAEDTSAYVTIDPRALRSIVAVERLSREKRVILEILASKTGSVTVAELSSRLRRDASTVRRHLRDLKKKGLVLVRRRKPLTVEGHPALGLILRGLAGG